MGPWAWAWIGPFSNPSMNTSSFYFKETAKQAVKIRSELVGTFVKR